MRLWGHALNFEAHWLGQDGAEGGLANPQVEKKGCLILGMTQVCSEEQGSEVPMRMELRTASFFIAGWTSTSGYMWPRSWVWRCNSRGFVWMTSQHLCYAGSGLTSLFPAGFIIVQTDYAAHKTWPWLSCAFYLLLIPDKDNSLSCPFFT